MKSHYIDVEVPRTAEQIALKRFLSAFGMMVVKTEANKVKASNSGIAKRLKVSNQPEPECTEPDDSLPKVA